MDVTLLRHATLLVDIEATRFLVDPMLSEAGSNPPVENTPNQQRNPLVDLPDIPLDHDAVLVTHRHPDHWSDWEVAIEPKHQCSATRQKRTRSSTRVARTFVQLKTRSRSTASRSGGHPHATGTANSRRQWHPSVGSYFEGERDPLSGWRYGLVSSPFAETIDAIDRMQSS